MLCIDSMMGGSHSLPSLTFPRMAAHRRPPLQLSPMMDGSLHEHLPSVVVKGLGEEATSYAAMLNRKEHYNQFPGWPAPLLDPCIRLATILLVNAAVLQCAGLLHRDLKVRGARGAGQAEH
jgi:hypothetical protein